MFKLWTRGWQQSHKQSLEDIKRIFNLTIKIIRPICLINKPLRVRKAGTSSLVVRVVEVVRVVGVEGLISSQ